MSSQSHSATNRHKQQLFDTYKTLSIQVQGASTPNTTTLRLDSKSLSLSLLLLTSHFNNYNHQENGCCSL